MNKRREPSAPPLITGFEPVRLLGMGGFADVFVYRQQMPAREVAVKVLSAQRINESVRERFRNEANLMAQLSQHPAIVTIHHADVANDGRPFLVMELCSRPGLGARYRSEQIPLAEALRLGVRLASAVESAHRMGILHYDIKPANVLTTDFGWPALTDFGIASTIGQVGDSELGLSIPWSPPELLSADPTSGDPRSDVYSLIATIYSAVAGRSPYEIPGGQNGAADLMHRIETTPAPPTGRAGVPTSLELVFEKGLAKDPRDRFQTPIEVAQALQRVEKELDLPETHIEIAAGGDNVASSASQADQETRVRPIHAIDAARPIAPAPAEPEEPKKNRAPLIVALASIMAVAIIGAITWAALSQSGPRGADISPDSIGINPTNKTAVPTPANLIATPNPANEDSVIFRWENPAPLEGDKYLWAVVEPGVAPQQQTTEKNFVVVDLPEDGTVCIEVALVRSDRRASDLPATECAP